LLFVHESENNTIKETVEKAIKEKCDLSYSDLRGSNLSYSNLRDSNLRDSDLRDSDLRGSNLRDSDLRGSNLSYSDLRGSNLRDSDLRGSKNINEANFNEGTAFLPLSCPEIGGFYAFKKCKGLVVTLYIPSDAKRSSATSYKCRGSKAKCISIEGGLNEIVSDYDANFIYKVGKYNKVDNFNENRWVECSTGIHFFMSKELAKRYN